MFPKHHRLTRNDFKKVMRCGLRRRGRLFGIFVIDADKKDKPSQVGIIISKKTNRKAAKRNKLKRQIRDILIRFILKTLIPGKKVVIIFFQLPEKPKYLDIKDDLVNLFRNI